MKSKEQKRAEAIERANWSYVVKRYESRGVSLQEYLNQFRRKEDRIIEEGNQAL